MDRYDGLNQEFLGEAYMPPSFVEGGLGGSREPLSQWSDGLVDLYGYARGMMVGVWWRVPRSTTAHGNHRVVVLVLNAARF